MREVPNGAAPCPFCGSRRLTFESTSYWGDTPERFFVCCDPCEAQGPLKTSMDAALMAWNSRSTDSAGGEHGRNG